LIAVKIFLSEIAVVSIVVMAEPGANELTKQIRGPTGFVISLGMETVSPSTFQYFFGIDVSPRYEGTQ
jgi:hypothetical protein